MRLNNPLFWFLMLASEAASVAILGTGFGLANASGNDAFERRVEQTSFNAAYAMSASGNNLDSFRAYAEASWRENGVFYMVYDQNQNQIYGPTDATIDFGTDIQNLAETPVRLSQPDLGPGEFGVLAVSIGNRWIVSALAVPSYLPAVYDFLVYGIPALCVVFLAVDAYFGFGRRAELQGLRHAVEDMAIVAGQDLEGFSLKRSPELMTASIREATGLLDSKIKELQSEKAKTKTIFDSMPNGFIALDGKGNTVMVNAAAKALGQGKKLIEVPILNKAYQDCLHGKEMVTCDWEEGGKTYQVQATAFPFDAKQTGVAFFLEDVTEKRRLEIAKSDFFAYASHELKSPLTSIIGYQQLIKAGLITDPKEIDQALSVSLREAEEMREMIRDMLDISALESRKDRSKVKLDLKDTVLNCLSALAVQAKAKSLTVIKDLDSVCLTINPQDAERIVRNLVSNAIKYNRPNGTVFVRLSAENGGFLEVSDTGIGMAKAELPKIFDRFYRGKGNSQEGTGLGLAIVKHACAYYGFGIHVESEPGKGSTFRIRFQPNLS